MKTKKHIKYIIFLYFSIFKNNVIINSQQISLDDKKKELTTIVKEINDIPKQVRRDQREQFATSNKGNNEILLNKHYKENISNLRKLEDEFNLKYIKNNFTETQKFNKEIEKATSKNIDELKEKINIYKNNVREGTKKFQSKSKNITDKINLIIQEIKIKVNNKQNSDTHTDSINKTQIKDDKNKTLDIIKKKTLNQKEISKKISNTKSQLLDKSSEQKKNKIKTEPTEKQQKNFKKKIEQKKLNIDKKTIPPIKDIKKKVEKKIIPPQKNLKDSKVNQKKNLAQKEEPFKKKGIAGKKNLEDKKTYMLDIKKKYNPIKYLSKATNSKQEINSIKQDELK